MIKMTDHSFQELPEDLINFAKHDLRENQYIRQQSLDQLRDWLAKNEDIINMRTDDSFLLRFLRAKKFSVPMAEQTILKYLNIRRVFPHLSTQLDYLNTKLNEVICNGYIFAAPKRDRNGRRVVIVNAKSFDAKLFSSDVQAKAHFLTYECLMEDAANQMLGVVHVGDFNGVTTQHITNWNPNEFARIFKWGEQSFPMRHKAVHLINIPTTIKWLIEFTKNRVSIKMQNRLQLHNSINELSQAVGAECLPQELGGHMPMREMLELWKQELLQKRDIILKLDQMHLLTDHGIQNRRNACSKKVNKPTCIPTHMHGSFRKLEID